MPYTARLVRSQATDGTQKATVHLGNGVRRVFTQAQNGNWHAPQGQDDTLYAPDAGVFVFNGECGAQCMPKPRRSYRFEFDGRDYRLAAIADKNGNALTIGYDGNGRIDTATDANARSLTFAYNTNSRVETVSDFDGRSWTYGYDADDNLTTVTGPEPFNQRLEYRYDNAHNLLAIVDAQDRVQFSVGYGSDDKATDFTDNGGTYDLSYDPVARVTAKTNPEQGRFEFRYDENGNITEKTDPFENRLRLTWDANVDVTGKENAKGVETAYGYDEHHNLIRQVRDEGGLNLLSLYEYDPITGQVSRTIDPRGIVTEMSYDANGNLDQVTRDPSGVAQVVDYTYDARGLLAGTVDADGVATAYEYDASGYLTRVYNPNVDPADPPTRRPADSDPLHL